VCEQEYCLDCRCRLGPVLVRTRCRRCDSCRSKAHDLSTPSPAPDSPPSLPPAPPLFGRELTVGHPLSPIERAAAVTLCRIGETQQEAAERLGCTRQTVAHWQHTFEETREVADVPRSGRPHLTTYLEDTAIVAASVVEPFTTPRGLKRKVELDVSPRTIDRRLIEAGLPGRVAKHMYEFTEEHIRQRLSFAEGYKNWTEEQWESVLFTDETSFKGAGFSGQVWVRRPVGEALNPLYTVDKKPHPVKVHLWGCFSASGLGYSYIFNENLDAKLLKSILSTHLIPSAQLLFPQDPPQQWWLLQDNDPKHRSREIRSWLHNHGTTCLDFPPYSPDLNPMENLWNDMARRVELRLAETVEQLQHVVAEEWAATSTELLKKLAHSMPNRGQAVIDAKGHHTSF
jgi:transposase